LIALMCAAFGVRAVNVNQPIVENDVGRQVPTAMVARHLDGGASPLRPELDTGPFPNWFVVEPPVFALGAVGVHRATGLSLTASGRLLSALGITFLVWGLFGLARRREGVPVAFAAAAAAALVPVTIRYGRAFQGDALMMGCLVAGLRCWDEALVAKSVRWTIAAWVLCALGLALKVTSAYILLPLLLVIVGPRRGWRWAALAASSLLPALFWYAQAWPLLSGGGGSRASADNAAIWLKVLVPSALGRVETYRTAAWLGFVRTLTPIGAAVALWGLVHCRSTDRLWAVWGLAAGSALLVLAAKLHHAYYWLALVPLGAVGIGRALVDLAGRGSVARAGAIALGIAFLGMTWVGTVSTWRTPAEWAHLDEAAAAIRDHVPRGSWVVAPEALLFAAGRRGCRLERDPTSVARAAGEWGETLRHDDPVELVALYRDRGAEFVADVGPVPEDGSRCALHAAIRRRYRVLVDRPGVLLARLAEPEEESAHVAR
jgi:hypothetical protein